MSLLLFWKHFLYFTHTPRRIHGKQAFVNNNRSEKPNKAEQYKKMIKSIYWKINKLFNELSIKFFEN